MDLFLTIDINIFALVICACMFVFNLRLGDRKQTESRLFRALILCTMSMLVLKSLFLSVNGQADAQELLHVSAAAIYWLAPLPPILWALFASYQLYHDTRRLRKEISLMSIVFGAGTLLSLTSPLTGFLYYIGSDHLHHRGPLVIVMAAISLIPVAYTSAVYIRNHRSISGSAFWTMMIFPVILAGGTVFQLVFEHSLLYYACLTLAIFVVHARMQNKQFHHDHLTGLFNRRQLDSHIAGRINAARKGGDFSCIMLDIDNFKDINDSFGHIAGDEALKEAASILKTSIRSGDFLARYAGDEFVVVIDTGNEKALKTLVERIHQNAAQFSRQSSRPYALSFSVGYSIYRGQSGITRDEFIAGVDAMMYRDKNNRKTAAAKEKCRLAIARIKAECRAGNAAGTGF